MLNRIVGAFRRWNRARLERRHLAKANPQLVTGFFGRLVQRLREKNHGRLSNRRAQRQLLASLAANDTALLEGLVFVLKSARKAEQARAVADEDIQSRLGALDERVTAGLQLVATRLSALEGRLPAARTNEALPDAARPAGRPAAATPRSNGEAPRVSAGSEEGAKRGEPASASAEAAKVDPLRRL